MTDLKKLQATSTRPGKNTLMSSSCRTPSLMRVNKRSWPTTTAWRMGGSPSPVRKSFLYYFQKRLRLDVAEALDEPAETPVIIENKTAFDKALSEARKFESQKIVVKN